MTDDLLEHPDKALEESYKQMETALEQSGNYTTEVEEYVDETQDEIDNYLKDFRHGIREIHQAFNGQETEEHDTDMDFVLKGLQEAGQNLVNAYQEARELYDTAMDAMDVGNEALTEGPVRIPLTSNTKGTDMMNRAVDLKEEAFEAYDEIVKEAAEEAGDYTDPGMSAHIDVGLGQQKPDLGSDDDEDPGSSGDFLLNR